MNMGTLVDRYDRPPKELQINMILVHDEHLEELLMALKCSLFRLLYCNPARMIIDQSMASWELQNLSSLRDSKTFFLPVLAGSVKSTD